MTNLTKRLIFTVYCLSLALGAGCTQPAQLPQSLREAEKEFVRICQDEFQYKLVTRSLPNTFWIYIPTEEKLFDLKAAPKLPPGFAETPKNFSLEFLDGSFEDDTFKIEYDIINATKPKKDYGYTTAYTDEYSRIQNNILGALSRVFFDINNQSSENGTAVDAPDFIIFVVANITSGLETQSTFYIEDFKRYMSQSLPYDEYAKRFLSETRGDKAIIGDRAGRHLEFKDLTWPEFLTEQIVNRVRFKYVRSDFTPTGTTEDEILASIAATARAYDFTDFERIKLTDLRADREFSFGPSDLARFSGN